MSKQTLPLAIGTSWDFALPAEFPVGTVPPTFSGGDAIASTVSMGLGEPVILQPATAWDVPASATFTISFNNADTAAMKPGIYQLQTKATHGGRTFLLLNARLELQSVPGTGMEIPVYTAYSDLEDLAPWVGDLHADEDETWFLRQQGMAREWLDEILISRYAIGDTAPMIGSPGFGLWSMFAAAVDFAPSKWLRDQIKANTLIVQPKTIELVACRALFYICQPQLGKQGDVPYRDLARQFAKRASDLVKTYRAEIDLNNDGYADIIISCGSTSLR
jgi:hypothetical protein